MPISKIGKDCRISDKCSIYGDVKLGDNVRIDDFVILSGDITIGDNVHIACYSSLIGHAPIIIEDYAGVSMKCSILSSNADYSGDYLTNPNLPEEMLNTRSLPVVLRKHSIVGAHCVVLPGVTLGFGSVLGACSMTKVNIPSWQIWAGVPARYLKMRNTNLLKLIS
jgi:galactoside O-acetyltransferase